MAGSIALLKVIETWRPLIVGLGHDRGGGVGEREFDRAGGHQVLAVLGLHRHPVAGLWIEKV